MKFTGLFVCDCTLSYTISKEPHPTSSSVLFGSLALRPDRGPFLSSFLPPIRHFTEPHVVSRLFPNRYSYPSRTRVRRVTSWGTQRPYPYGMNRGGGTYQLPTLIGNPSYRNHGFVTTQVSPSSTLQSVSQSVATTDFVLSTRHVKVPVVSVTY